MKYNPKLHFAPKLALALVLAMTFAAQTSEAVPIRAGFNANTLAANDDLSVGPVAMGFSANFFGAVNSSVFVNNNGNLTFGSSLSTFTPFDLTSTASLIIAPFFADVDTNDAGSPVTYGTGTVGGQAAFGANYVDVDYFNSSTSHTNRNSFQVVLVDRSDIAAGDFDIEFNYEQIQWETGTASGGDANGLGGNSARVGFSNGTGAPGTFFELAGSAVNGAFLDGGPAGTNLIGNELNSANAIDSGGSTTIGRYVWRARNGTVQTPDNVPEPSAIALFGIGLVGLGLVRRRRKVA